MKYSTRLSDAIHILVFIATAKQNQHDLSSTAIATSLNKNPSQVRQVMSTLRKAGLLLTVHGHSEPQLSREPAAISFCDVYQAVDDTPLLHINNQTNTKCSVGKYIPDILDGFYDQVQAAAQEKMQAMSLQQVIDQLPAAKIH